MTQPFSRSGASGADFLLRAGNPDGGWAYAVNQPSCVEATAAVTLALRDRPDAAEARSRGLAWLVAAQNRDGGWGLTREDGESGWQTAWAALVLAHEDDQGDPLKKAIGWLLRVEAMKFADDKLQGGVRQALAFDPTLRGWPWLPNQASWVEPTALAVLALANVPAATPIAARLDEAVRYLQDRRCTTGGWNVGNPVMLGASLPPRAEPTAWVMLALAPLDRDAIVPDDITALRSCMQHDGGTLALAWGLLALRVLGEDDAAGAARLAALQASDGGWDGNPYHTAVAMMAERGGL